MPSPNITKKKNQLDADLKLVKNAVKRFQFHAGTIREAHAPNKLLLDYDTQGAPCLPWLLNGLRELGLQPTNLYYARSSSGTGWHVAVYLARPLPLLGTFFVQLYLGSDRRRERCNFIRAYHHRRRDRLVQILFDKKFTLE